MPLEVAVDDSLDLKSFLITAFRRNFDLARALLLIYEVQYAKKDAGSSTGNRYSFF